MTLSTHFYIRKTHIQKSSSSLDKISAKWVEIMKKAGEKRNENSSINYYMRNSFFAWHRATFHFMLTAKGKEIWKLLCEFVRLRRARHEWNEYRFFFIFSAPRGNLLFFLILDSFLWFNLNIRRRWTKRLFLFMFTQSAFSNAQPWRMRQREERNTWLKEMNFFFALSSFALTVLIVWLFQLFSLCPTAFFQISHENFLIYDDR